MVNKLAKNIVIIFSFIILALLTIVSMFYITTVKDFDEHVIMNVTTSIGLLVYLAIDAIILLCLKKAEKKVKVSSKIKNVILIIAIGIYAIISILWVNHSNVVPVDDSKSVNDLAVSFASRRHGCNKKQ